MPRLGVNIDHIATLRQARREFDPDPIAAALLCEKAGAHSIVAHLREDRRHINDADIFKLRKIIKTRLNMEMSINKEIVDIACKVKPNQVTLVPEKRQELTTEGGLDVSRLFNRIKKASLKLQNKNIEVSLFIDPIKKQIDKTKELGINMIELHTGEYACANTKIKQKKQFDRIKKMTAYANNIGIIVNVGHGLKYDNTKQIAQIKGVEELNIGHSIIARAAFVGIEKAVKEMLQIIKK